MKSRRLALSLNLFPLTVPEMLSESDSLEGDVDYSEAARTAGVSTDSMRRCTSYLEISFQAFLLDGREVELLVETPRGYVAVEIKMSATSAQSQTRHFRDLEELPEAMALTPG
jgi:hypothetical protein